MKEAKYEIVKFVDDNFELEVNVSPTEETVWLSQDQMSELFQKTKSTINEHIRNAAREGEINLDYSMRKFGISEFSTKPTNYYNLDVVIAVGYRIKSLRGVVFRKWATAVLRRYMLKGYVLDSSRVLVSPENYINLVNVVNDLNSTQGKLVKRVEKLEEKYPKFDNKLFFKGQMYDAFSCIASIIQQAKSEIILIDGYVDTATLDLLSKKKKQVAVNIYTNKNNCKLTSTEINDFNKQYGSLTIQYTTEFHDRFLILDKKILYHIGASIKDAGKKAFEISQIDDDKQIEQLLQRLSSDLAEIFGVETRVLNHAEKEI